MYDNCEIKVVSSREHHSHQVSVRIAPACMYKCFVESFSERLLHCRAHTKEFSSPAPQETQSSGRVCLIGRPKKVS